MLAIAASNWTRLKLRVCCISNLLGTAKDLERKQAFARQGKASAQRWWRLLQAGGTGICSIFRVPAGISQVRRRREPLALIMNHFWYLSMTIVSVNHPLKLRNPDIALGAPQMWGASRGLCKGSST